MILSINPGSSSLKYKLFDSTLNEVFQENIAIEDGDFALAINKMLKSIETDVLAVEKIAVRVVHGGPNKEVVQVDESLISEIENYSQLASLHNPQALKVIKSLSTAFGYDKIFAVFDTGYFSTLSKEEKYYAIGQVDTPIKLMRYGFHGISHKAMQEEADPDNSKKIITIHLGAGCSMTAISSGKVISTSMGLTPDEGLVMQTRSGDLDPGLVLYLVKEIGLDETKDVIEKKSGLAGLTGTTGSMIDILLLAGEEVISADHGLNYEKTDENVKKAKLALNIYINKIKKYIGSYSALMGGLDTVVFSGKIGVNSKVIREKVMNNMDFLGDIEVKIIETDEELTMAKLVNK